MARFHAEATANLVAAKLLAGAGPSVADAVVASITRDEVDLESTNAMRAAMAIAQAATSAGPKGGREQTPLRARLLALALLHRSVTRAIAEEQAGISRADIPGLVSRAASDEADAANVRLYRDGGMDSLAWTLELVEMGLRQEVMDARRGAAGWKPALLRACANAVADVGRVCAPNAEHERDEPGSGRRVRALVEDTIELCDEFASVDSGGDLGRHTKKRKTS